MMIFLFIFFSQFLFAHNSQVLIIHMPGEYNEGLNFLNSSLPRTTLLNQEYNQNKTFYHYTHENLRYTIYTNNCPFDQIALGGKKSVTFFTNMIKYGHQQYPDLPIILAGASGSTAAIFGTLTKLAKKESSICRLIKGVIIEACLASSYDVINYKAEQNRFFYPFTKISKKLRPLIVEYLKFEPFFNSHTEATRFTHYDAFAPQAITFVSQIKHCYSKYLNHIQYYIVHNKTDPKIPVESAKKVIHQLEGQCIFQITAYNKTHIISAKIEIQNGIYDFIATSIVDNSSPKTSFQEADYDAYLNALSKDEQWFIKTSKPIQWIIRRIRDSIICRIIISGSYILIKVPLFLYTKITRFII